MEAVPAPDMYAYAADLIGQTVYTAADGKPNTIVSAGDGALARVRQADDLPASARAKQASMELMGRLSNP